MMKTCIYRKVYCYDWDAEVAEIAKKPPAETSLLELARLRQLEFESHFALKLYDFLRIWTISMLRVGDELTGGERRTVETWLQPEFARKHSLDYSRSWICTTLWSKLDLQSAEELVLKAAMAGLDSKWVVEVLGDRHVNAEGEVWHHMKGEKTRLWFKDYEPMARPPEVWNGDLNIEGELGLSELDDLSGCPDVVNGRFTCINAIGLRHWCNGPKKTARHNDIDWNSTIGI